MSILNGFRDASVSVYSSKIVNKKDILGTFLPVFIAQMTKLVRLTRVEYVFEDCTFNIRAFHSSREDMACCCTVQ